jgi:hypothetical protein
MTDAADDVAQTLNELHPEKNHRVEAGAIVADEPADQLVDGREMPGSSGGGR